MNVVKLYTRKTCPLCETAKKVLLELQKELSFQYIEINIGESDYLTEKYGLKIPVVEVDGKEVQFGRIDKMFIQNYFTKISKC